MSKINIPLDGHLNVPIQMLLDDPLLVLKKFPLVETLEVHGPLDYHMVTVPFALINNIPLRRRWYIKLQVDEENQKLLWLPTSLTDGDGCDGWIEGECADGGNGRTRVTLNAVVEHRFLNMVASAAYRNALQHIGHSFLMGFEKNLDDPTFENTVPV